VWDLELYKSIPKRCWSFWGSTVVLPPKVPPHGELMKALTARLIAMHDSTTVQQSEAGLRRLRLSHGARLSVSAEAVRAGSAPSTRSCRSPPSIFSWIAGDIYER